MKLYVNLVVTLTLTCPSHSVWRVNRMRLFATVSKEERREARTPARPPESFRRL